jgi:hypothetical protein
VGEILTRLNARVGRAVWFRDERRLIEEVSGVGVWLSHSSAEWKPPGRDFLYFWEASKFGVTVEGEGGENEVVGA